MDNDKKERYRKLVEKRKACSKCACLGMKNPSLLMDGGKCLDPEEIDGWALWQNSLDADILLIGQEWGDVNGYLSDKISINHAYSDTNKNIIELFKLFGIAVDYPETGKKNNRLFFTNAALCLKETGGAQGETNDVWYQNCSALIKELISIVKPKLIITLGKEAYRALAGIYYLPKYDNDRFSKVIERSPNGFNIKVDDAEALLFPVYHPARRVINMKHRTWEEMQNDWARIAKSFHKILS